MKNFTTEQLISELGLAGEKIIINYLSEQGRIVKQSIDKFDSQKDITVDGNLTVEVKTQQPYVIRNSLSFRPNQLKKCSNVDILYFVTTTAEISPNYKWNNCIFEVDPKNFKSRSYTTKFGIKMIDVPIEQEAVKFIKKLTADEAKQLSKYTHSDYKAR